MVEHASLDFYVLNLITKLTQVLQPGGFAKYWMWHLDIYMENLHNAFYYSGGSVGI